MKVSQYNLNQIETQGKLELKGQAKNSLERIHLSIQNRVILGLELIQDLIVILLCLALFGVMFLKLKELCLSLISPVNFQAVTPDILFILILVEIFRLLIIYLQEKEISVGVAVEIAIVSVLREVILRGVMEIPTTQIWAICGILLVLGIVGMTPVIKIIFSKIITSSFRKLLNGTNSALIAKQKKLTQQNQIMSFSQQQ